MNWKFLLGLFIVLWASTNSIGFAQNTTNQDSTAFWWIRRVTIECNHKTVDRIIFRELSIKAGDRVAKKDLDSLLVHESHKLMNTKLFVMAEVVPYPIQQDTIDLIISVIEKWYFYPIPIIDFADRNYNEWAAKGYNLDRLIYGVRLIQNNFRGRKETLKLYLQLGFTRVLDFEYNIPYINKDQTTGLTFQIGYANAKNINWGLTDAIVQSYKSENILEEKFSTSIGLNKRTSFYNNHTLSIKYSNSHINDTVVTLNPNYYQKGQNSQRYFQLRYRFEHNRRDNSSYPLQGKYMYAEAQQTGLLPSDDISVLKLEGIYAKFIPLSKKFYYSGSWRGQLTFPQLQPFNEMRGFGFNGSFVRGLDIYRVNGQHFAVWKNTLRFQLFSTIFNLKKILKIEQFNTLPVALYLKTYGDAGYVHSNFDYGSNVFTNQLLWGAGTGIDLVFYNSTVFRFEYSVNKRMETGFFMNFQTDF